MANTRHQVFASGKKVYYVSGQRFYNDKNAHNGLEKAKAYCLDNLIDTKDIIQFDSDTETDYYEILLERQQKGEISNLAHHYLIRVQEEYVNANGDTIPEITYNADFIYKDLVQNKRVVVDIKSSEYFLNNDGGRFILLKTVFDKVFKEKGLYIQIIIKKGKGEFYEWHIGDKQKSGKLIKKQSTKIKELRKQLHDQEIADRKAGREKARLLELRELKASGKITKAQLKRLEELEVKYKLWVYCVGVKSPIDH